MELLHELFGPDAIVSTPLHEAASKGDFLGLQHVLQEGADPNIENIDGCTALHYGLLKKIDIRVARVLLDYGADPNHPSNYNMTPFMEAVKNGTFEMVKLLLKAGADVNAVDKGGMTPLMFAKKPDVARFLVGHGAHLDEQDNDGMSALISAAAVGNVKLVKTLIGLGADIDLRMKKDPKFIGGGNVNAEEIAALKGNKRIANYLKKVRLEKGSR